MIFTQILDFVTQNFLEFIAIIIAVIAIIFTALKDFILPWFRRPNFVFLYEEKKPFRKEKVQITNEGKEGAFLRMKVKNMGKDVGKNCRCQIFRVIENNKPLHDYEGLPLKWAGRPEVILDPLKAERLNIGQGETEFIDIISTRCGEEGSRFEKYHPVDIGISNYLPPGKYTVTLIFSGDNFKPSKISFDVQRGASKDYKDIKIKLWSMGSNNLVKRLIFLLTSGFKKSFH
ncbi:MAG: hypothetical protein ABH821_00330 [archaeon]